MTMNINNPLSAYWITPGEQVELLNRLAYMEWAGAKIVAGWVPATPESEWKCHLTYVMWQDMQAAQLLRTRKEELSGSNKINNPSNEVDELIGACSRADSFYSFLAGWFLEFKKWTLEAYERYEDALDPIFDAPLLESMEALKSRLHKQIRWAKDIVRDAVEDSERLVSVNTWRGFVRQSVAVAGGIDGRLEPTGVKPASPVAPDQAAGPGPSRRTVPSWIKQDSEYDFDNPPEEVDGTMKVFMWHLATEIQVIDPMCYIFYGIEGMPFEFYMDYGRHIWDESRHHQMGVRRLKQYGIDAKTLPIPFYTEQPLRVEDYELYYTDLTLRAETCSFSRKNKAIKAYYDKGDIISGMTGEFDVIDERTHVNYGKKWSTELNAKIGNHNSVEELQQAIIERWMDGQGFYMDRLYGQETERANHSALALTEEERKGMKLFAFCGKTELQKIYYDKL